jgi:hypothetical protein
MQSPYVWWHWVNGCISKEGITNDLEAMAKQGIGGATIFNIQQNIDHFRDYQPVYASMSPEWREMVRHAMQEADRLGLKILMHHCDGFGTSGGTLGKTGRSDENGDIFKNQAERSRAN